MSIANSIVVKSSLSLRLFKMKNHYSIQYCRVVIHFCPSVVEMFSNCCRTYVESLCLVEFFLDLLNYCWFFFSKCYRFVVEFMSNHHIFVDFFVKSLNSYRFWAEMMSNRPFFLSKSWFFFYNFGINMDDFIYR